MATQTTLRSTDRAVDRVFNTVEVLQAVLLCLEGRKIATAQRTSKCFYNAVLGSEKLIRKIHIRDGPHKWRLAKLTIIGDGNQDGLHFSSFLPPQTLLRMQVSQPPVARATVCAKLALWEFGRWQTVVEREGGGRWGDLCKALCYEGTPSIWDAEWEKIWEAARLARELDGQEYGA